MGIRSSLSTFGERLRAAIADDEKNRHSVQYTYAPAHALHDPYGPSCRVCAVSQYPKIDVQQLCNSHRAHWLTSRPLPPLPLFPEGGEDDEANEDDEGNVPQPVQYGVTLVEPMFILPRKVVSYSSKDEWCSHKRSQYSSFTNDKKYTPYSLVTESSSLDLETDLEWRSRKRSQYGSIIDDDDYIPYRPTVYITYRPLRPSSPPRRSLTPVEEYDENEQLDHALPFARLIVALQTALLHVRYAISGHLALRLYDPLWDMGLPSGTSHATKPSIVCPMATRDVLPSWAAASHNAFRFDPMKSDCLRVLVGKRFITVAIQWVDDCEFGRAGSFFEIDQTRTVYNFAGGDEDDDECFIQLDVSPPILSLKSLLQHLSLAYIASQNDTDKDNGKNVQKSLGFQVDACLQVLVRQMAPDSQFLMPYEVPAIHDSTFLDLYYTAFGTMGMQLMLAVSGGMPPLTATTSMTFGSPSIARPSSTSSVTSIASTSSVSLTSSSSSAHSIRRKPLPSNSQHIILESVE
ncbi:hypothetical protein SBRCBS47491_002252 [Sporothrix bragantina]|uniref:Uncharacterized protein n=1 Tax=Sporothrix bragantina TaxID=671064 RepID=A0ABP0B594_9PEZI